MDAVSAAESVISKRRRLFSSTTHRGAKLAAACVSSQTERAGAAVVRGTSRSRAGGVRASKQTATGLARRSAVDKHQPFSAYVNLDDGLGPQTHGTVKGTTNRVQSK